MSQLSQSQFSFANSSNAEYIESLYLAYKQNPTSVDESWRIFFEGFDFAVAQGITDHVSSDSAKEEAKVEALINAFRRLGHISADIDPLSEKPNLDKQLTPEGNGLEGVEPTKIFHPANLADNSSMSFQDICNLLVQTYCGKIGPDFRELNNVEAVVWLQNQMESVCNQPTVTAEVKLRILNRLAAAEGFERFLQDRYLGQKRFSLEGNDTLIPLLDTLASEACDQGVEEINLGMAHRGRLNVLANFMGKSDELMLEEFEGTEFNPFDIDGDVKYHKGFASEITTFNNKKIRLLLLPNPSHLEAVNPVVEGFTRARQRLGHDAERKKILPVLMHGDAAFIGQGIVAETLNLADLEYYGTGGTIHIITNNQIGFTAEPQEGRSCKWSSDIVKILRAPVLHVNADDPEAVIWTARLAVAYRQTFGKDIVIDLIGYRRHGHNETDEPGFTQPLMYKKIKTHATVFSQYSEKLAAEGIVTKKQAQDVLQSYRDEMQKAFDKLRSGKKAAPAKTPDAFKESLAYYKPTREEIDAPVKTGLAVKTLTDLGMKLTEIPKNFSAHPKITKLFESRRKMLDGKGAVDWGMAEILAIGSLALDGFHVRLSGQDCQRGTFSHRHAVLKDYENGQPYNIFSGLGKKAAEVDIINSPLSEQGVLGFDFGYSVADRKALVLWEAQFGDFANGAQIIIDQFLVASEAKWKLPSSLVLLLPHGYEGMGPEHSSARPERFLQLCGNFNIQVINPTTPSQFFHALRRQMHRNFQKPMVVMTPKSLLRHPKVISPWENFANSLFDEVIDDEEIKHPKKVERLVVCSGKIYYDLMAARENLKTKTEIPVIRIEQLYPFPWKQFEKVFTRYSQIQTVVWTQEEPVNMGSWMYIRARLEKLINGKNIILKYVGRKGSGTTAEGSIKSHQKEQERIINEALGIIMPQSSPNNDD